VPTIKGKDDIYFITEDKQFTSISRVKTKDIRPETLNIGFNIKRLLEEFGFDFGRGIEDKERIYIPARSKTSVAFNDILLVYNLRLQAFEGIWDLPANFLESFNDRLYYAESIGANVYEMNIGQSDDEGGTPFPISSETATHFMNLSSSHADVQALNSLYFEGYIKGDTVITFQVWKDFSSIEFLTFDFSGTETTLLDGTELLASLGSASLGLKALGQVGQEETDGRRHFFFRVFFPFQYGNHFSVGWKSSGLDFDYEITRFGLGLKATVSTFANSVKSTT